MVMKYDYDPLTAFARFKQVTVQRSQRRNHTGGRDQDLRLCRSGKGYLLGSPSDHA